ncbi:VOC family protein [Iodidimonas sp. SYSU 1G8]|uniref:VOC family protein n=1 Tax=Iodidimonas sp. SYSU 1G8 TaxID=3133967 RepID=UPI0031FE66EC
MSQPDNRLKLRQIALVARDLHAAEQDLTAIFGVQVAYRDPAVAKFGLENIVVPVGDQFLEVVAPTRAGTAAERYLERRGGDGGYMVILQCADPAARDARIAALGIRTVLDIDYHDYDGVQLHPQDTGGSFLEVDWAPDFERPDGPWHPAGDHWRASKRTEISAGIAAVEIQSADPETLAARWGRILAAQPMAGDGLWTISLGLGSLRFTECRDERGEGLAGIDILLNDPDSARREASRRGRLVSPNQALIGGVRFALLTA